MRQRVFAASTTNPPRALHLILLPSLSDVRDLLVGQQRRNLSDDGNLLTGCWIEEVALPGLTTLVRKYPAKGLRIHVESGSRLREIQTTFHVARVHLLGLLGFHGIKNPLCVGVPPVL